MRLALSRSRSHTHPVLTFSLSLQQDSSLDRCRVRRDVGHAVGRLPPHHQDRHRPPHLDHHVAREPVWASRGVGHHCRPRRVRAHAGALSLSLPFSCAVDQRRPERALTLSPARAQLAYLNRALRLVGPTLICPLAFCAYNCASIASGLIYFRQLDVLSALQGWMLALGTLVLLGGVWIVSVKPGGAKGEADEDAQKKKGAQVWADEPLEMETEPDSCSSDDEPGASSLSHFLPLVELFLSLLTLALVRSQSPGAPAASRSASAPPRPASRSARRSCTARTPRTPLRSSPRPTLHRPRPPQRPHRALRRSRPSSTSARRRRACPATAAPHIVAGTGTGAARA